MRLDQLASRASRVVIGLPLVAAACGDDSTTATGTGNEGTTTGSTTSTGLESSSEEATTLVSTGVQSSSSEDSGPVVPECEAIQCGDDCCFEGSECVLGQCFEVCESAVRCGADLSTCCADGNVCLQPSCIEPGDPCGDNYDCPEGQFCEPTLQACLPQPDDLTCEVFPDFEDIQVTLEWSNTSQQITTMPVVADVDGDGLPEVIVNTFALNGGAFTDGIVMIFEGESGQLKATPQFPSYGRTTMGAADVDGNGVPDIIVAGRPPNDGGNTANNNHRSLIYAIDGLQTQIWESHRIGEGGLPVPAPIYVRNGAPSFANFDDDAASEIVWGTTIIDNDGLVVFDQPFGAITEGGGGLYGSNATGVSGTANLRALGGISAIADVFGNDGHPEIVSGRQAWVVNWLPGGLTPNVQLQQLWDARDFVPDTPDGWPAVADIDQNGTPEVILVANGTLRVLDGATGRLWCGVDPTGALCNNNDALRTQPIALPGGGRGGPPTVADFDGDGRPEAATAGGSAYTVFDFNRAGEEIVQPNGNPPPAAGDIYVRWSSPTEDVSSNGTGSSVFDFQGDGVAEVLYGDECYFRVYNGATGAVILEIPSSSVTNREYPIVVDADGDGNSEIVVVANDSLSETPCTQVHPGYQYRRGVFVYGDPNDQWVRTRRVWPSHTYHVTNAEGNGNTPVAEANNWTEPGLNNYRQNFQGEGVFNAPDLSVELVVSLDNCLKAEFELLATVRNNGSLGVAAGVPINLYEGTNAGGVLLSQRTTNVPLLPGGFTLITWAVAAPNENPRDFYVAVDGADTGTSTIVECNEDNNDASTTTVSCPIPE